MQTDVRTFMLFLIRNMIDFNSMLNFLGLFDAYRLENSPHCPFTEVFTFLCNFYLRLIYFNALTNYQVLFSAEKLCIGFIVNLYLIGLYTPIKLFWAVCHLFPQRWRTLTYSVWGNHWSGGQRDMLKTTSARKF